MASELDKELFSSEEDVNNLLLFTNGRGEPKCVDIERCISDLDASGNPSSLFLEDVSSSDFIDACPRVPLEPISFSFINEGFERSRFIDSRGVQFSYQCIYKKGFFSALAPYSDIAVPPAFFSSGNDSLATIDSNVENTCVLTVPKQSEECIGVRIIFREGNDGVARVIEDIYIDQEVLLNPSAGSSNFDLDPTGDSLGTYRFKNDVSGYVISETERLKTFDNVPREVKAQEVTEDRVVYGNYTEGYNNITVNVETSVEFGQEPPPGYEFKINAIPTVFKRKTNEYTDADPTDTDGDNYSTGAVGLTNIAGGSFRNRIVEQMGFLLDDTSLPDEIASGSYNVSISITPKNNFHFYCGVDSLPSSIYNTFLTQGTGFTASPSQTEYIISQDSEDVLTNINDGASFQAKGQSVACGGADEGYEKSGVNRARNSVKPSTELKWESNDGDIDSQRLSLGSSATAPLILKGKTLNFEARITVPSSGLTKGQFMEGLAFALYGGNPLANPIRQFDGSQNLPVSSETWFKSYSFDLGLNDEDKFDHETSSLSDLISIVTQHNYPAPKGFYIIDKATGNFCLEPAWTGNGTFEDGAYYGEAPSFGKFSYGELDDNGSQPQYYGFQLTLANLSNVSAKTCIPMPKSGFGSIISPQAWNSSIGSLLDIVADGDERHRAVRFNIAGTSKWDYTGRNLPVGEQRIAWPSTQRLLDLPTSGPQGPANMIFSGQPGAPGGLYEIEYTTSGGNLPMAGGPTAAPYRFVEVGETNQGRKKWMPAPIGSWTVYDDADKDQQYWTGKGIVGYIDVPGSTDFGNGQAQDLRVEGRPRDFIPGISNKWEGKLVGLNNSTDGYSNILFSFDTYPGGNSFFELKSRSVFSGIDGDGGPGGAGQFGTRSFGSRGGGDGDSWGLAAVRGCHPFSAFQKNIRGRHANIRGSVTNFTLTGSIDNMPGFQNNEVMSRRFQNILNFQNNLSTQTYYNAMASEIPNANLPFALFIPRFIQKVNLGQAGGSVIFPETYVVGDNSVGDSIFLELDNEIMYGDIDFWADPNVFGSATASDMFYGFSNAAGLASHPDELAISLPSSFAAGAPGSVSASAESSLSSLFSSSFKTKANHEFGMVYYDKKGRHGSVQPINSVYVPGYDERGVDENGPSTIVFDVKHAPPSWADSYRFVYAGNTNVESFIQYSVDGAKISESEGEGDNNIYVSINSIQGSNISFQSSYSAVNQLDGSKRLYSFAEGDFIRVLKYSDSEGSLVYPETSWQFQIVDLRFLDPSLGEGFELGGVAEGHPFGSDAADFLALNGQFLVLEDNPDAVGFNRDSVEAGADFWGDRCIVEIIRPKKDLPEEATAYYETNYGGRCLPGNSDQEKTHEFKFHYISKGDVYYRSTPMNVQNYDSDISGYVGLVGGEVSAPQSYSNFIPYFVEAQGWTDFFVSDSKNYGRLHFVNPKETETNRPSSITFSEQTELGSYDTKWLSFPRVGNYKDFNYVNGGIDVMDYDGVFMNVFMSESVIKVPYNRNFLMDGNTDTLIASLKVFGTPQDVDYEGGTSGHPESLIRINQDYFFISPDRGEVVMLQGRKSPVIISEMNMSSYLRREMNRTDLSDVQKFVTGWDNENKELIVTLYRGGVSSDYDPSSFDPKEEDYLKSVAFDLKSKKYWKSRYSFSSPMYAIIGDNMISWHKKGDGFTVPWVHGGWENRSRFYGDDHPASFTCHVNDRINESKSFDAVVTDSKTPWNFLLSSGEDLSDEIMTAEIRPDNQKRYYGKWYGKVPRVDTDLGQSNANAQRVPVANTSHVSSIPAFPYNYYKGNWIQPEPAFKITFVDNVPVIHTRTPIPDGHPFWKTSFPNGPSSFVYEANSEANLPNDDRAYAYRCGSNFGGTDFYDDSVTQAVSKGWRIEGASPNSRNFIGETGNTDVATDLIFSCKISDSQYTNVVIAAYIAAEGQGLVNEDGFVRLADIYNAGISFSNITSTTIVATVLNVISPVIYGAHLSGPPLSSSTNSVYSGGINTDVALTLIFGEDGVEFVQSAIAADLDGDGNVAVNDILTLLQSFGATGGAGLIGDIDDNGQVGVSDILAILTAFGVEDASTTSIVVDPESGGTLVPVSSFAISAWLASIANLIDAPNPIVKKDLYASYVGSNAGRHMRGRTLDITAYSTSGSGSKLFGIDVDYNLDVKSTKPAVTGKKRR